MRSKYTRWAADMSGSDSGNVSSIAIIKWIKRNAEYVSRNMKSLVEETFGKELLDTE